MNNLEDLKKKFSDNAEDFDKLMVEVFNEVEKIRYDATFLAIGWAYADCCSALDKGTDPRHVDMTDVITRATKDLELKND